jgi:hypothetical protein
MTRKYQHSGPSHRLGIAHLATRYAGARTVFHGNVAALWYLSVNGICVTANRRGSMLTRMKRVLGWIVGPLYALVIVVAVYFFERKLRLEIRRDPAWRSQEQL